MVLLQIKVGKKKKRTQSVSLSDDCLEELINILDMERNARKKLGFPERRQITLSHIIETACWRLIEDVKKQQQ